MKVLVIEEYLPQEMLGVMWLSRAIKDAGHDCKALFLPDKEWVSKLKEYNPDVVAYSMTTGMHLYFADINRKVKEVLPNVLSVAGGPHPTFVPEYIETPGMDAICRGEGEVAIVDLLNRLRDGKNINDCENFWIKDRKTGEIHKNPQRTLVQDLDSLGFPDRSVVYDAGEIYRNTHRKVFTSQRGCPMPCSFCFHHALKKKVYNTRNGEYVRKRSVTHVLEEIKQVRAQYPLKFVHFVDDIFNLRNDWLDEFCERYPKEIGLPFDVILMANMTTEDHIKKLKSAGCVYARVAFEAANDYVRNAVFKKHTTRQQLVEASAHIRKYGIRLGSLNMLGGPGSTLEDEFETVKLNIECKVDHPLVSIMQPYPSFDINDITREMGYAIAAYDDFPEKFNRTSSILFDNKHEIENLHKLFPMIVRWPSLLKIAPWTIKRRWLAKPLLISYMLFSEWMVAEQARIYSSAQGLKGPRYWAITDFTYRLGTKGVLRVYQTVFAKVFERFFAPRTRRMQMQLQMGDERVVAHMD